MNCEPDPEHHRTPNQFQSPKVPTLRGSELPRKHRLQLVNRGLAAVLASSNASAYWIFAPALLAVERDQAVAVLVGDRGAALLDHVEQIGRSLAVALRDARVRARLPRVACRRTATASPTMHCHFFSATASMPTTIVGVERIRLLEVVRVVHEHRVARRRRRVRREERRHDQRPPCRPAARRCSGDRGDSRRADGRGRCRPATRG